MILEPKTVHVPAESEVDADVAEYGSLGNSCAAQFGLAAIEAGAPDYPDGELTAEAIRTGAVDAIVNVLHCAEQANIDLAAALRSAINNYAAEAGGTDFAATILRRAGS